MVSAGLHRGFYLALIAIICIAVMTPSIATLAVGDALVGILNLLGLLLFLLDGPARNRYVNAAHRYADDRLRIALLTSHHEGTIYVLPSSARGLDAVWTRKIANEHLEADSKVMRLFQHIRSERWSLNEPFECLRSALAHYQQRVSISPSQIPTLASWGGSYVRAVPC